MRGRLSHPLGKPVAHNTAGPPSSAANNPAAAIAAKGSPASTAVNAFKILTKLPSLAGKAADSTTQNGPASGSQ